MIYALLGKSCSGKSTAFHSLIDLGYVNLKSFTTRPKRPNEVDGEEYQFISKEEFLERLNSLLIVAPRMYNDWYYGIDILSITHSFDQVVIVDPDGLERLEKEIGKENVSGIYLKAPDDVRFFRSANRFDSLDEVKRRMKTDEDDFRGIESKVDYVIDSTNKEKVVEDIERIIKGDAS